MAVDDKSVIENPDPELMAVVDASIDDVIEGLGVVIGGQIGDIDETLNGVAGGLGTVFNNLLAAVDRKIDPADDAAKVVSSTVASAVDATIGAAGETVKSIQDKCRNREIEQGITQSLVPSTGGDGSPVDDSHSPAASSPTCILCGECHSCREPCEDGSVKVRSDNGQSIEDLIESGQELFSDITGLKPKTPAKFITWFDTDKSSCYTQPADISPRSQTDLLAGEGQTETESVLAAGDFCQPTGEFVTEETEEPAPEEPESENGKLRTTTPFKPGPTFDIGKATLCRPDSYSTPAQVVKQFDGAAKAIKAAVPLIEPLTFSFPLGLASLAAPKLLAGTDNQKSAFVETVEFVEFAFNLMARAAGCGSATSLIAPLEAMVGLVNTFTANSFGHIQLPLTYSRQALCPTEFPTSDQATAAYLANAIPDSIRNSWWNMNNRCTEPMLAVLEASRNKIGVGELLQLRLRKKISGSEWDTGLRQLGYLHQSERNKLWDLSEFIPPYTDITRFMVRDAFDQRLVAQFQLDKEFDQKFNGKVVEWAEAQGIRREVMQAIWRSHWTIPSPGQLYQMIHRLDKLLPGVTQPQVIEWAKDALAQQDIAPFWRDKLIAISFIPKGRRDIRRAFGVGSIDRAEVQSSFEELGHNAKDADILTDFVVRMRDQGLRNSNALVLWRNESIDRKKAVQLLTDRKVPADVIKEVLDQQEGRLRTAIPVRLYKADDLSRKVATERLTKLGIRPATIKEWLDDADRQKSVTLTLKALEVGVLGPTATTRELTAAGWPVDAIARVVEKAETRRKINLTQVCQRAIRRAFLTGEITDNDAMGRLRDSGTDPEVAGVLVAGWNCERAARGKSASTSQVIKWFDEGHINAPNVLQRLENIGWGQTDRQLILATAIEKINIRNAKQQRKLAEDAMREAEKQQKAAEKARRKAESDAKKRMSNIEKANRTRERIVKQLEKVQAKLADKLELSALDTARVVEDIHGRNISVGGLTTSESARSLVLTLENTNFDSIQEFIVNAELQARAVLDLADA